MNRALLTIAAKALDEPSLPDAAQGLNDRNGAVVQSLL